jgi:hypothetical protein
MKGVVFYVGEEWQLTSKSKLGKRQGTYVEVRDWSMPKVTKGYTEVTLVNGRKHILPGKRKSGQVYKALGVTKSEIKTIKYK